MKKQILILLMSLFALAVMAEKTKKEVTFNVPLDCQNCINKVEKNIAFEKGVKGIACDLSSKTVKVTYIAEKTDVDKLKKGFAKIGYKNITVVGDECCESKAKEKCSEECHEEKPKECCSTKEKKCENSCKETEKHNHAE